jgi:hypothetical protein
MGGEPGFDIYRSRFYAAEVSIQVVTLCYNMSIIGHKVTYIFVSYRADGALSLSYILLYVSLNSYQPHINLCKTKNSFVWENT